MKLSNKIAVGFTIPIVLLIAVGVLARIVSDRLTSTTEWVQHSMELNAALQKTLTRLVDAETGARGFFLTGDDVFLEPYATAQIDVASLLDHVATLASDDPAQYSRVESIRGAASSRLSLLSTAIDRRRRGGFEPETAKQVLTDGKRDMDLLRQRIRETTDAEANLLGARKSSAASAVTVADTALTVAVLLGVLASIVSSVLIARSILVPIRNLQAGVDRVSRGDLAHRIEVRARDESGELAENFNTMVDRRREAEEAAASLSLQRERVLTKVAEISNQLAAAAEELQATTASQASGAQQQSAAVAETTTVVEEVVQTSAQAAERAQQVSELARQSADVAANGQDALGRATATMDTARTQANRVATSILSLAEQAQSIGEIIATVDDISEQSNLLALNAALEAARAGDRGRGFAVVAAEMKSLAEQSKGATVHVRRLLGAIQKQSNEAVLMTEASTRSLGEASTAAESVGTALSSLVTAVTDASQAVAQIAASARQQSGGLQQVNQAMRDVAAVANQNLATTRQVGQAARDLTTLGGTLRDAFAEKADGRS